MAARRPFWLLSQFAHPTVTALFLNQSTPLAALQTHGAIYTHLHMFAVSRFSSLTSTCWCSVRWPWVSLFWKLPNGPRAGSCHWKSSLCYSFFVVGAPPSPPPCSPALPITESCLLFDYCKNTLRADDNKRAARVNQWSRHCITGCAVGTCESFAQGNTRQRHSQNRAKPNWIFPFKCKYNTSGSSEINGN